MHSNNNKSGKDMKAAKPDGDQLPHNNASLESSKPFRILSTSLGVALAANMMLMPTAGAEGTTTSDSAAVPKLLEWSSDEVKQYFDPKMDWNIPLPASEQPGSDGTDETSAEGDKGSSGQAPMVIHNGFGWSDLLLYHMIFNRGSSYSSSGWSDRRPVYDSGTNKPYQPKTFNSGTFENRPVVNSRVKPKTVDSSGKITRRSTKASSSSSGGIGSKSSGFSSSGKSSGRSFGG